MARLSSDLDLASFVEERKRSRPGYAPDTGGEHAYAYRSDRTMRATFEKIKPVELAVAAMVRRQLAFEKGALLGGGVKVGPNQFPRVFELSRVCADTLGIAPPTVYVVSNHTLNAMTFGTNEDSFVVLHSALVDHLSDTELLDVIGHECGHIHNDHVVYLTTLHLLNQIAMVAPIPYIKLVVFPAMLALNAWQRRAEVTSDRAGLLCSKDLEAATRTLAKLAVGSQKLFEQLNLEAFLAQYEEGRDAPGKFKELFAPHPFLPKRIMALKIFSESALYRKHAGLGDEGKPMQQVDDLVNDIVRVVELG